MISLVAQFLDVDLNYQQIMCIFQDELTICEGSVRVGSTSRCVLHLSADRTDAER